jgi:uncharacterized membrane protein
MMPSKFSIAGHPLHPTLVGVPIGLFVWTLIADLVYVIGDRDVTWYDIAFWTGIAAVLTALFAALPGFGDYFTMAVNTDARGMATAHMLLNLTIVLMYGAAALLMLDDGARDGGRLTAVVSLHAAGTGLLALSGWLGGEMVFRHHLATVPDTAAAGETEQAVHLKEHHVPR